MNPDWQIHRQTLLFLFLLFMFSRLEAQFRTPRKIVNFMPVEMPRSEVMSYFRTILRSRISSFDKYNEEVYLGETFPEDLYHSIDNLMPRQLFSKYLMKTKNITDRTDSRGISMLYSYQGVLNSKCNPITAFNHSVNQILKLWDGDKTMIYNDLEEWHGKNMMTSPDQICNRFRGLTCQYKKATSEDGDMSVDSDEPTCQCAGDGGNVGFFTSPGKSKGQSKRSYPDGCYIRAWKPCKHLSQDYAFRNDYYDAHTSLHNQRRLLAQIVFPVARTHRCKQGTYCLDLVPGMKQPVCWCSEDSEDKDCVAAMTNPKSTVVPAGVELAAIRRNFVKLFISVNNSRTQCNPKFNEIVERIANSSGSDPTTTGVLGFMKELAYYKDEELHICDFRKSLFCDAKTKHCVGRWVCDPGKVHLGMGVCAVDNGFSCQSNEECVEKAKCLKVRATEESVCMCERGYGHRCRLESPPFFGRLFHPIESGFRENEFILLQENINNILESWEDNMKKDEGETCDPALDKQAMELVNYFGNLLMYDKEKGGKLLKNAQTMTHDGQPLCYYNKFLRCHSKKRKCVPMLGYQLVKRSATSTDQRRVAVELEVGEECGETSLPTIFRDVIELTCPMGHACKTEDGRKLCMADCNSVFAPKEACDPMSANKTRAPAASSEYERVSAEMGTRGGYAFNPQEAPAADTHDQDVAPTAAPPSSTSTVASTSSAPSEASAVLSRSGSETILPVLTTHQSRDRALYGEECKSNETETVGEKSDFSICNGEMHQMCVHGLCRCFDKMVYREKFNNCVVPLGGYCDPPGMNPAMPDWMEQLNGTIICEFGVCRRDTVGKICRPETDNLLLLTNFEKTEE